MQDIIYIVLGLATIMIGIRVYNFSRRKLHVDVKERSGGFEVAILLVIIGITIVAFALNALI